MTMAAREVVPVPAITVMTAVRAMDVFVVKIEMRNPRRAYRMVLVSRVRHRRILVRSIGSHGTRTAPKPRNGRVTLQVATLDRPARNLSPSAAVNIAGRVAALTVDTRRIRQLRAQPAVTAAPR